LTEGMLPLLKKIGQHYHASFGEKVPRAIDVAIGRVAAATTDDHNTNPSQGGVKEQTKNGAFVEEGRTILSTTTSSEDISEMVDSTVRYADVFVETTTMTDDMDIPDPSYGLPYSNFSIQDMFAEGSYMSFVDYFNYNS